MMPEIVVLVLAKAFRKKWGYLQLLILEWELKGLDPQLLSEKEMDVLIKLDEKRASMKS
ncbi:hypothetical protein ACJIZ3_021287 [Penstemon smallii]|uniref:Uncharacterized protein n=1 Tax=Penstemon smallii TaxID=265156 RepID=A0ABD3SLP9_9LAMI